MDPHGFGSLDQDSDLDTHYRNETNMRIQNNTTRYLLINLIFILFLNHCLDKCSSADLRRREGHWQHELA
jgi:hypothetical protein